VAVAVGQPSSAATLFSAMREATADCGNPIAASYFALKEAQVAIAAGGLTLARDIFTTLPGAPGVLDLIELTPSGVARWAATHRWEGASPGDRAVLLTQFCLAAGRLMGALGRYDCAAALLREGLRHTGGGASNLPSATGPVLEMALAGALLERGDLAGAEAILDPLASPEIRMSPARQAERLRLLARLALLRGELGAARHRLEELLALCADQGYAGPAARAQVNLAHLLILLNHTSGADTLLRGAERLAFRAGDRETARVAARLRGIARARSASLAPRVLSAVEMWREQETARPRPAVVRSDAPGLSRPGGVFRWYEDRALAFHWLIARGDLDAGGDHLASMRKVLGGTDSEIIRLRLLLLSATLDHARGRLRDAARTLDALVPRLRESGLATDLWTALRLATWCADGLDRPRREVAGWRSRAVAALDALTLSLDPKDRSIFLLNKWMEEEAGFASEVNHVLRVVAAGRKKKMRRALVRGRVAVRLHRLLRAVDRHRGEALYARVRGDVEPGERRRAYRAPGLLRALATHPRDRATLTFIVFPDAVAIVSAGWMRLDLALAPISRVELRQAVQRWHEATGKTMKLWEEGASEAGLARLAGVRAELLDRLAADLGLNDVLDRLPRRVRALTIVADDALHAFPFAAVRRHGRYLAEDYALTHAFSPFAAMQPAAKRRIERVLLAGVRGDHAPREREGGSADGEGTTSRRLDHVPAELAAVEAWAARHGASVSRLDEECGTPATRQGILDGVGEANLAHLACHGMFVPDHPDESGLQLFPAPGVEEMLTMRDFASARLGGVRHVTLSSCSSSDGFSIPGRWVLSLPETLCRAGAGSALGCAWPMDDGLASHAQSAFYASLRELPLDAALQRVQLAAIRGTLVPGDPDTADPTQWAALTLYGDPRRLHLAGS
jgi:hypothetical protein